MAPVHIPILAFLLGFFIVTFLGAMMARPLVRVRPKPHHLLIGSTAAIAVYALYMAIVGMAGGLKFAFGFTLGVFLVVGLWYINYLMRWDGRQRPKLDWSAWTPPDIPTKIILWLLVIFQLVMFLNALAPHVNQDADVSHYLFIREYLQTGQVAVFPQNAFSYYPQALEMAVLTAFGRAGEYGPDAANLCFWFMQLVLIGWLIDFSARRGKVRVGYLLAAAACGLFYWPVIAYSGFVDGGVTLFSLAGVFCYLDWLERREKKIEEKPPPKKKFLVTLWRWQQGGFTQLALTGLFLGTACASKYSALPVTALVFLHLLWITIFGPTMKRETRSALFGFAVLFLIAALPWYGRNILVTGNPLFPFMRGIFGGPELTLADDVNTWASWGIPVSFANYLLYPVKLSFFWPLGDSWLREPLPYISWLFVLSPIAGLLLLHRRLTRLVVLWCFVFFTFAFFFMNVQTRYFLPFTILALWLVIEWLETFASQTVPSDLTPGTALNPRKRSPAAKWVVLVIVLIPFMWQLGFARGHLVDRSRYLVGGLSRDEYITAVWPSREVFAKASELGSEDSKVMIFSLRTYYLDAPYVFPEGGDFDPSISPDEMLGRAGANDVRYLLMESRVRMGATILDWCVDNSVQDERVSEFVEGEVLESLADLDISRNLTREILKHRGGVRSIENGVPVWRIGLEQWRDPKIAGILDFLANVNLLVEVGELEPVEIYGEWELYALRE